MKRYRGYKWLTFQEAVLLVLAVVSFVAVHAWAGDEHTEPEKPMELIVEAAEESSVVEEPVYQTCVVQNETVWLYDVPLEADLQLHIIGLCKQYHIEPSVVMAMIERESNFRASVMGDSGNSYGLMQVQKRWHEERMERLGVTDLLDPYQNVLMGIDYLAELCERYEDIGMALMAYNAGPTGAKNHFWSKGIFENKYSSGVLERSEELMEGMVEYVLD